MICLGCKQKEMPSPAFIYSSPSLQHEAVFGYHRAILQFMHSLVYKYLMIGIVFNKILPCFPQAMITWSLSCWTILSLTSLVIDSWFTCNSIFPSVSVETHFCSIILQNTPVINKARPTQNHLATILDNTKWNLLQLITNWNVYNTLPTSSHIQTRRSS